MERKACLNSIPRRKATSAPVQAPVTGRGTATKSVRPILPYLSTVLPRRLVRLKSHSRTLSNIFILLRYFDRGSRNKRRKGTGRRLPRNETKKTEYQERSNSNNPVGIPPRSSDIGAAEIRNTQRYSRLIISFLLKLTKISKSKTLCQINEKIT